MIDNIQETRSTAPLPSHDPIQGFGEISALGCSFAAMIKAFSSMYEMMQSAGIEEAELSSAYNESGVKLSKMKEKEEIKLRTQENSVEADMASLKHPATDDKAQYEKDQLELQTLQAQEGAMKNNIDAKVTIAQSFASDASNQFTGALKNMNALFDSAKSGIDKILGTAMSLGNPIANQH